MIISEPDNSTLTSNILFTHTKTQTTRLPAPNPKFYYG
jgi:hypothetical protein